MNEYEAASRSFKVDALVAVADRYAAPLDLDDATLADALDTLGEGFWQSMDAEAQLLHPSSCATRAQVIATIRLRGRRKLV